MNGANRTPLPGAFGGEYVQRCAIALLLTATGPASLTGPAIAQTTETTGDEQTRTDLAQQIEELRLLLEETKRVNEEQNEQLR